MKKGGDDEDEKKEGPKREEFVETPPEPPISPEQPVSTIAETTSSLEERVEVLEGQVQPRTTGA
jgi:hypothetical protein